MVDDPPATGQVLFKKYYKTAEEKKASRRASTATAVGGFEAWSPERVGEFVFRAGKPYEPFKNVFVEKGVTGALIAQYLLDGDLKDALTELGIKEDLRQVALEGQFKKAQKEAATDGGAAPPPALGRQASVLQKASSMQAIEWKDLDVVKYLGKGSYGKVYSGKLGVDVGRRLARPVALKVFTSAMSNDDRRCDAMIMMSMMLMVPLAPPSPRSLTALPTVPRRPQLRRDRPRRPRGAFRASLLYILSALCPPVFTDANHPRACRKRS